jgi:hypothetical protein
VSATDHRGRSVMSDGVAVRQGCRLDHGCQANDR